MPSKDPFSGMKLSQQIAPPKLDQRLFSDQPAPESTQSPDPQPERPATAKSPTTSSDRHRPSPTKPGADAPKRSQFDLADEALYKATFTFSQPELEALEDLKLQFRRDHDTKVTKNDLIRAALHLLLEDHATKKKLSYITRKLLKR